MQAERDVAGQHRSIRRQRLLAPADDALRRGQRDERLLELVRAGVERPGELLLLAQDRAQDRVAPLEQVRVDVAHEVDHDLGGLVQERLAPSEEAAVTDGAAQDAAQDVAPALVGGQHAVTDRGTSRRREWSAMTW